MIFSLNLPKPSIKASGLGGQPGIYMSTGNNARRLQSKWSTILEALDLERNSLIVNNFFENILDLR